MPNSLETALTSIVERLISAYTPLYLKRAKEEEEEKEKKKIYLCRWYLCVYGLDVNSSAHVVGVVRQEDDNTAYHPY